MKTRFERNVKGPFYTTGECMACGAPENAAPTLLAPLGDDNHDTYFVRQPESQAEIVCACHAARVCCVSAIRYGGRDASIIQRLGNREEFVDHPIRWWQFWR
jgi:hypothetical protein